MTSVLDEVELVATDLDGTLLAPDGQLTRRTTAAVLEAQQAGLSMAFLTARPLRGAVDLLARAGFRGALATSNGAVCVDVATSRHLFTPRRFEPREVASLLHWARRAAPRGVLAVDTGSRVLATGPIVDVPWAFEVVGDLEAMSAQAAFKVLVQPSGSVADLVQAARRLPRGLVTATRSTPTLLELGPPGADKAHALTFVAGRHGVALSRVLAVGDMPNDVPMLRVAGVAAAPANADEAVLSLPGVLTVPSNADDGVAQLLELLVRARRPRRELSRRGLA